jgi:hypothetical protein
VRGRSAQPRDWLRHYERLDRSIRTSVEFESQAHSMFGFVGCTRSAICRRSEGAATTPELGRSQPAGAENIDVSHKSTTVTKTARELGPWGGPCSRSPISLASPRASRTKPNQLLSCIPHPTAFSLDFEGVRSHHPAQHVTRVIRPSRVERQCSGERSKPTAKRSSYISLGVGSVDTRRRHCERDGERTHRPRRRRIGDAPPSP